MKLLVLGASGGCGRWICRLATDRGHEVRALVRPSTEFEAPSGVEVIRGQVLDKEILEGVLTDMNGVLSGLGIKRKSPNNPWSEVLSPPDLTTRVAEYLRKLMPKKGIQRVISISAAGAGDSFEDATPIIKWLIRNSNMSISYKDLEQMESVYRQSDLDWQAVRPTTLTNGPHTGEIRETDQYGLLNRISRANVAHYMLDCMESQQEITNRTPLLVG